MKEKTEKVGRRRDFIKAMGVFGLSIGLGSLITKKVEAHENHFPMPIRSNSLVAIGSVPAHGFHPLNSASKSVNNPSPRVKAPYSQSPKVMNPMSFLTHFDLGKVIDSNGKRVREFTLSSYPSFIEVASKVSFPAWTFNGTVPGPTLRCVEGETIRIKFLNGDIHPHTIHFHGIHPANMDGVFEIIEPGKGYTYEFKAEPFGVFPYHCHTMPITKHIAKGLYGTLIIDPKEPRPKAKEMVMVMNGFDVDFDGENEFYTVNGIANYYMDYPIRIKLGELIRIYLVNMTEFDLINSFHLHANMFWWYPNGTSLTPSEYTDTVMLCQGQRGIMEFSYKYPGRFLFHAHQSEFAERGWIGMFEVFE
ncbi:MAG: multicopper oxidase domain-containing protein [Nitrososphaerales archaeon]